MAALDARAIEDLGIPRLLLMEHAGLAVARAVAQRHRVADGPVLILCGTGFNGGDGLAAARHLHQWGYALWLVLAGRREALREEPAAFAAILERLGAPLHVVAGEPDLRQAEVWLGECRLVVDALLGAGLRGPVREPAARLIALVNAAGRPVVAVDVPSGLDGDRGEPQGVAVAARVTVTFGRPKQGCVAAGAARYVGELLVDPITLPPNLLDGA
jgi:NAD(P)H-hydrate epimerase